MTDVRPGRPAPLGATWDGTWCNVAVRSTADALELCLLDSGERVPMRATDGVFHVAVRGLGPGSRYGLRAHGPWDPDHGRCSDPSKLLVDPYARRITGRLDWDRDAFARGADTEGRVPVAVVADEAYDWGDDRSPGHDLADSVVLELHVRTTTMRMPGVPEEVRGTYAALSTPAFLDHLERLGVTTVELLPVHAFVDEPHLQEAGLTNLWGYNSVGWFAPHEAFASSGDPGRELKDAVKSLHARGLDVLLDVVYNHTADGDAAGPQLSFRGLDDGVYRREGGRYVDWTGCGNTVDLRRPDVLQTVMDSLRHWVEAYHVDGFRFDLAVTLARGDDGFDPRSAFLACVAQDPVLAGKVMIAEPWDVGPDGWHTGGFPRPWAAWNDRYRDAVRDTWRGADLGVADLAYRLTGSSDLFAAPSSSISFVTAHDGFSLADLVSYDLKHNEANGEQNRDGTTDNRSWNGGVEGPTDDAEVLRNRRSRRRSMLATLLLSTGVPMLRAGDEVGATQRGNTNAYCQDNEIAWTSWDAADDPAGPDPALTDLVARLVRLRRAHPVFRRRRFFTGQRRDVGWFTADGTPVTDWSSHSETLGVFLSGDAIDDVGPNGEPVTDGSYLLLLNACAATVPMTLPDWAPAYRWVLDTARDDPWPTGPATGVVLEPWTVVLLEAA